MLRLALVVTLTLCLACGSSSQPEIPAGKAEAGKVIERVGKVTATRESATRALAVGNAVAPDDVIATAADSSVVIELSHNNARWSLEAGITSRVDTSVAWTLPKQDAAKPIEHATSSAGRHADRQAADTQITARPTGDNGDPDADREAATAKLDVLRKQAQMQERTATAKDSAAKAERKKGIKISQECMNNPLARGCDGPELDANAKVAIQKISDFATELCACKDMSCAKKVEDAYKPWRARLDKKYPPASQIGGEIASGSATSVARYNQCRTTAGL